MSELLIATIKDVILSEMKNKIYREQDLLNEPIANRINVLMATAKRVKYINFHVSGI